MKNALLFGAYTVLSVLGLVLLKLGAPALRELTSGGSNGTVLWKPILQGGLGAILYVGAFAVWILILTKMELSAAFPIAIGLTLVGLTITSALVLKERIGIMEFAGILFIFIGIFLVYRAT